MILLLDNFDSFTYILADYLQQLNVHCEVKRSDVAPEELLSKDYKGIVLSPGPETPMKSGNMMKVIDSYHHKTPILGICLGHQGIGEYFGARLIKADRPMHGKVSEIFCDKDEIFEGIPEKIKVVRYHSLVLSELPSSLRVISKDNKGEIMAIRHETFPLYGLQFHPEAVLSEHGLKILKNWLILHKIVG
ncbi:MAG: aminodeoxychorismate/anthranilate synthase component II [Cytophagaceae bacterium]|nr:aminodeoxychorismate/anthranilate synthase component II [Cytophagaceae bacterium]